MAAVPYRVGGKGALVVYDDHVEVPGPARGVVLRLSTDAIVIERAAVRVHVGWAGWSALAVRRGELITFRSHGGQTRRVLSTLTSPLSDFEDQLMAAFVPAEKLEAMKALLGQAGQLFEHADAASPGAAVAPSQEPITAEDRARDAELEQRIDARRAAVSSASASSYATP